MQAIILAAGKGTRIYPMAINKPKPLISVANKPVLEHNLDQMVGIVDEAVIVVGYQKDKIINHFGKNYRGIKLTYVVQEERLGTGHAVGLAENHISGQFLVINGDDLFSRRDMINIAKYNNCVLVQYKEDASAFGAVVIKDTKVKDIVEKSKEFVSNFVNTGMYCFTPEVFEILKNLTLSERGEYELTDALKVLAQQEKMYTVEVQGHWIPVGYPWHLLEATEEVLSGYSDISIKGTIGENVVIEGSVDMGSGTIVGSNTIMKGSIVIGKNCSIGKNVKLEGFTAISDGTIIEDGAQLNNAIVGAGAKIEQDCVVRDSVLGDEAVLSKGVTIQNTGKQKSVNVYSNGKVYDSGREKLGAFVGDKCKVHRALGCGECVGGEEE